MWRDNCRDWLCHLYAYATPTTKALDVIKKYSPLIEIGAGTGYWSSLLKLNGVDIQPYDIVPPSSSSSTTTTSNEFHGKVPTFTNVSIGGAEMLTNDNRNKSLFLCYPPPLSAMASECLQYFRGKFIIYVGEWQGNTADLKFEEELQSQFNLVMIVKLPNWSNTYYNLSVWERKSIKNTAATITMSLSMQSCHTCGNDATKSCKRCRLCRNRIYCSEECMIKDKDQHEIYLCQRLIYLKDSTTSFHSRTMFESL